MFENAGQVIRRVYDATLYSSAVIVMPHGGNPQALDVTALCLFTHSGAIGGLDGTVGPHSLKLELSL